MVLFSLALLWADGSTQHRQIIREVTLDTSDEVPLLWGFNSCFLMVHNATLELAMSSPGHLGKLIPEVQAFLLHYLLSDDPEVNARALRDPALRAFRRKLQEAGKPVKLAIVACARKLLTVLNAMLRDQREHRPAAG